jgi:cobalamin synthase
MKRGDLFRRRLRHVLRLMSYELGLFGLAWTYLTRIPLPRKAMRFMHRKQYAPAQSTRYVPLVGVFIGAIAGAVFLGAHELFDSKGLAILLALSAVLLASSSSSSTSIVILLVRFQALLLVPGDLIPSVFIAAHAFSQFGAASFITTNVQVEEDDKGNYKTLGKADTSSRDFMIMAFIGMLPLALVGSLLFLLLVPLLWVVRNLYGAWFIHRAGGFTNHYLALTQQLLEASCYLLVIIGLKYPLNVG